MILVRRFLRSRYGSTQSGEDTEENAKMLNLPTFANYHHQRPHPSRREGGKRIRGEDPYVQDPSHPLVSIVTVVWNRVSTLERTIQSVLKQLYQPIEYIMVDGGSTDGTLDVICSYDSEIDYWISEPDAGISDALNKGIALTRGNIIGVIHSDDWYVETAVQASIEALLQEPELDFTFGDCLYYDNDQNKPLFLLKADPLYARSIGYRMPVINHATVFVRRKVYNDYGLFSLRYRFAMDYDLLLRFHQAGVQGRALPEILACMTLQGVSHNHQVQVAQECRSISLQYRMSSPFKINTTFSIILLKISLNWILKQMGLASIAAQIRRGINRHYQPMQSDQAPLDVD